MSEKIFIRDRYRYFSSELVDDVIRELRKHQKEAQEVGWRNLTLEIADSGDGYYDGSPTLYVFGERLETDKEYQNRLKKNLEDEKRRTEYERQQYEDLKKKYG